MVGDNARSVVSAGTRRAFGGCMRLNPRINESEIMDKKVSTEVVMTKDKDCKGSVRFATADPKARFTNIYVSRLMPGIDDAQEVKVTVEIVK